VLLLQTVPYKGSLPRAIPTDPLIYRWYEIVNVYGTTIKEGSTRSSATAS
jgi:cyanate lyase